MVEPTAPQKNEGFDEYWDKGMMTEDQGHNFLVISIITGLTAAQLTA